MADCFSDTSRVQVCLTVAQVRSIFAAINTAGMLSAGRIRRHDLGQEDALAEAIGVMERAAGIEQGQVQEWRLD